MTDLKGLTPQEIVKELDKYIIGQNDAKRNVAVALRNRWRRMHAAEEMQAEIVPNNILMIGATGVGKTEIARRLAKIADAPFVKVEASKFTEVGYVGRDVESMVRDLVEQAVNMVKQSKKEEVKERAAQIVEDIILDALIPPLRTQTPNKTNYSTTVGTFSDEPPANDIELNERTRAQFREKLKNGELEHRKIEIVIKQSNAPGIGMVGAGMMDEVSMMNLQDMLSGMMPKKAKKRKVSVAEARRILLEEESARLIDMDEVKEEAIRKAENAGIIFIDEIDKIASGSKGGGGGPDVSREGVQRDLLPIVEGSTVNTKYGVIKTDHVLFVAAGAFHVSKPSDLIPELQGRFPIRVELNSLTKEDFVMILNEPKNALTKQYHALLQAEGVNLVFDQDAIDELADTAFNINAEIENIGARRLQTVMSKLLNEFLFDVPDKIRPGTEIKVDRALVREKLSGLIKNRDLSRYIL
ncbi:MAG TPA: ATP-dependent protease ATPase subunit HslU [Cyclobacteriaceae bacterium]|nr:ATP-dependent protease ATPase subunit HslU [Cyclobacteriaceae bacterium]